MKIPSTILPYPLFIITDWLVVNNVCDSFCAEIICVFAFSAVVAFHLAHNYSYVKTELIPLHRIYYWPNVSKFFFLSRCFICPRCQNDVWSWFISAYFLKTTNQLWTENSKMTGLKDCKSCQENVSLSLVTGKLN